VIPTWSKRRTCDMDRAPAVVSTSSPSPVPEARAQPSRKRCAVVPLQSHSWRASPAFWLFALSSRQRPRLRVEQRPVGTGHPQLGATAVAVPQLDRGAVGRAAVAGVQALAEGAQGLVAGGGEALGVAAVAGVELRPATGGRVALTMSAQSPAGPVS